MYILTYMCLCSVMADSATPRTVALLPSSSVYQAPLSMRIYRQEYWSGFPFPSPRDLPNPEMEPESPVSPALAGRFFTTAPPVKPIY